MRGDAAAFSRQLSTLAAEVEPGLRLYDLLTLEEVLLRLKQPEIQGMFAVLAITLLILALSAAGLYSLMSVAVTRRTREIGIRLAIGASPKAVLRALFARAAMQVGIGIVLANVLYPPLMKAIGVSELPVIFVLRSTLIASGGMMLVGLIACGVPARRALRIQPTEAVKYAG
jgi:putative ABC transport system permease protein